MSGNGKALVATAIAGLMVIGTVYWWKAIATDNPARPANGLHHRRRRGVGREVRLDGRRRQAIQLLRPPAERKLLRNLGHRNGVRRRGVPVYRGRLGPGVGPGAPCAVACGVDVAATAAPRSRVARPAGIPAADNESAVSTPIVLAMPELKAKALGWPRATIGWSDLLNLANDPRGWASKGHPEWGAFKLGKTNPNVSTSGLSATIGAFVAATGTSSDLTLDALKEPHVRDFVAGVEKSVAHYGDTALTFLTNLQRADDAGAALGYVSAVAVEEKSIVDYNEGNPTGDLETKGGARQAAGAAVRDLPERGNAQERQSLCGSSRPLVRGGNKPARRIPGRPA